jgi:hypothetical protein
MGISSVSVVGVHLERRTGGADFDTIRCVGALPLVAS